jgi:hypothetical protein
MTHHFPSTFTRNKDALRIEGGDVRADFNPLTGDYLVTGQNGKGSCPYAVGSVHSGVDIPTARRRAICLALTVHHYALTGEVRTFSAPHCPAVYGEPNTFIIPYSA